MQRILFAFSLIIDCSFNLIIPDRCQSNWHYLSDQKICILFGTTHLGDVSWKNGSQACEQNSAQLWTGTNSTGIMKKIKEEERYIEILQRGTWIGETNWSNGDFCEEDNDNLSLLCVVLTIKLDNQTLCLKRVSCLENHPFICQTQAVTEEDLENIEMQRASWWQCILSVIWCAVDALQGSKDDGKKQAQVAADKEAAAKELHNYLGEFETPAPDQIMTDSTQQVLLTQQQQPVALAQSKSSSQMYWIGGGVLTLILVSACCVVVVFVCKKKSRQNSSRKRSSIDSSYST